MIVRVQASGKCRLIDQDDFGGFHAELDAPAARAPDCGVWDSGAAHLWIDPAWLRQAGPSDAAWCRRLADMIAYAGTKGWLDDHGRIRAHVTTL